VVRRRRSPTRRIVALFLVAAVGGGGAAYAAFRHPKHHVTAKAAQAPRRAGPKRHAILPAPAPVALTPPPASARHVHPPVAARAAIVVDADSGRVLWAYRPHRRLPIASTTKIMTAVVALQRLGLRDVVDVNPIATRVPLVKEGLRKHERVRTWKLLDGLLIFSGNDDALALATAAAGTRSAFIDAMNRQARLLGLRDSHFSSPSGVIDDGNVSSAWDLATLTRFALRDGRFRRVVRTRLARVPWSAPTYEKVYVNKNALLGSYPGADGVKTGWTTLAGHCLVASATRRGRTIIVVLLNAPNVYRDARRLLDLGFSTR
jgi:serine-type D-Ala-D-Ala carboxypeptidase (penicillin-binding protein 5/6)